MNYQAFKDHLITFLWKAGDSVLAANLDNLIKMATSELDRKLSTEDRHDALVLSASSNEVELLCDYSKMVSVNVLSTGQELTYVKPAAMRRMQALDGDHPHYSLIRSTLLLAGTYEETPVDLVVDYIERLPDFATEDASWLTDDYLDAYTYTVLKHAAPFLKNDERIAIWSGLAMDALTSIEEDSAFNKTRGVSASMPLPRQASVSRRGR